MRSLLGIAVAAAAAASLAAPAGAQPGTDQPWSADGRLEDSDSQDADQHRYDDHHIRLEAGRRYRISAASDDFDTMIRLYRPGETDAVAENDDSGDSLNSRITYAPQESGDHRLRVTSFSAEGRGAYSARAETVPPLPPPTTGPGTAVSVTGTWSLWQGELGASDPDQDGRHYDDYLIRVEAGQTRYVLLESNDFDPVVQLLDAAGRDSDPPAAMDGDDDTGAGFNALLAFAPEEAGDYVVRVTSYGEGDAGAYRLWISR